MSPRDIINPTLIFILKWSDNSPIPPSFDQTSRNQACSHENLVLALQITIIHFKNNIMAFEHKFMTSCCPWRRINRIIGIFSCSKYSLVGAILKWRKYFVANKKSQLCYKFLHITKTWPQGMLKEAWIFGDKVCEDIYNKGKCICCVDSPP